MGPGIRARLGALLALPACAGAAVPGLPQPPASIDGDAAWVDSGNDNLSDSVLDRDDYRTGTLDAGAIHRQVALAMDWSVLTSRQARTREDQYTATAGWAPRLPSWAQLAVGVGARGWGDFGGARIQNGLHSHAGYVPLDFTYDGITRNDGLAFACGRVWWGGETSDAVSWVAPPGGWALSVAAAGLATTGGDREGEVESDLIYRGRQGSMWAGVRLHSESGDIPGPTARQVAWRERGWWLMAGAIMDPHERVGLSANVGLDPDTHGAFGTVGIVSSWAAPRATRAPAAVEEDLGYFQGAVIGAQWRWQPDALARVAPEASARWPRQWCRAEVALDYRFGGVRGMGWRDDLVLSDQLTIGPSLTLAPPALFSVLRLMPYGEILDGVRIEHVEAMAPDARFGNAEAFRWVTQLSAGVRVACDVPGTSRLAAVARRLRAGAGYDRWLPWHSAQIANGADRAEYLGANGGWGGYLGMLLDW